MNTLSELKKKLIPRSRWGAISLAPKREFGNLTWSEATDRPQPQDGAVSFDSDVADVPEISPIPAPALPKPVQKVDLSSLPTVEPVMQKPALLLLG